jgi:cyclopropane fatty-acyl-phospholipid synthase-like methyltransferase
MLNFIQKQFRKPSGLPGKFISRKMVKGNRFEYNVLIPLLDIKPGEHLFEIGYGPGMGIKTILERYDCHITGIDYSKLMLSEASQRNRKMIREGKVELLPGDFLSYQITPDFYDTIFCTNVVYFWESLEEPFTKILNGLKKGGHFCFFMVGPEYLKKSNLRNETVFNSHTIEYVTDCLKKAGFIDINQKKNVGYFFKCRK